MKLDSGNTAWMIAATALVLLMTPGLAFFYGGMVRGKNVLAMLMQNFICMGIVSVVWILFGFSLAFGHDVGGHGFIGSLTAVLGHAARHHRALGRWRAHHGHCLLPANLRRHYPGADNRRHRRPDEVRLLLHLRHAVVGAGLLRGRPLGVGRRLDRRQAARDRLRRWHGRPHQRRYRGVGAHDHHGQAGRLAQGADEAAQRALRPAGCRPAVVRLDRLQRRVRAGR